MLWSWTWPLTPTNWIPNPP